ncbi:MAG TPA: quinone-dependent dihydroorotate dehydrogenase [Elusimicrobiota bacterium]|nr:quinone-dependent dihydroorotate dehydrogenase [Elusimicrobiota bacterium]
MKREESTGSFGTEVYKKIFRPVLFRFPPEMVHGLVLEGLNVSSAVGLGGLFRKYLSVRDEALQVSLATDSGRLDFPNPVGLAAGFDKDASAAGALEGLGFGFLEVGTLTPRPQKGNPRPRLRRFPADSALWNRMGFNNIGAERVASRFPRRRRLGIPVGFNIGKAKNTPLEAAAGDYLKSVELLFPWADFFVLNVSSPNTAGLRELQAAAVLERLLKAVRRRMEELALKSNRAGRPALFVKVSPDESSPDTLAETVLRGGAAGIVATNTTVRRDGLSGPVPPDGGVSGRPLRERSTDMLRRLYRASRGRLFLIGVGGVFTAEDAYEKVLAGASLVEVYTGLVYEGPALARDINRGLLTLLKRDGFSSVREAVGKGVKI